MMLVNTVLNFEFAKIEKILREKVEKDVRERKTGHVAMNLGIVSVIRALITRSETDYNLAILQLTETQNNSAKFFSELTIKLYPTANHFTFKSLQLIDDSRFHEDEAADSDFIKTYCQRNVSELITAECALLQIFLKCVFTGEHSNIFSSLLSESELIAFRSAFMTLYHAHDRFKIISEENILKLNNEYRNGLMLSWGLCSLVTLLLPSQLAVILGTSGFQLESVDEALNLIECSASQSNGTLNSLLATLILIIYNSDLKNNIDEAKGHLDSLGQPKSALCQYFQAKLLRLEGQISSSIDILTKISPTSTMIQLTVFWQIIQCFAESQKWPEAIQYVKMLRDCCYPSRILSLYLEASFMQASTGRAFGPLSFEVQCLLEKILEASRAKHKSPRPFMDRLAITRARNVLDRGEHFFLPHFEIFLLWNRLEGIYHKEFVTSQVRKALESSGQLTFEQQSLGWLILAVLSDSHITSSKLIVNHILPKEGTLPSSLFVIIRSKCELARCLLLAEKYEAAKILINEIEMICFDKNGFPGQTTILLLLSKLKEQEKQKHQ
jgi:hypothetical protein